MNIEKKLQAPYVKKCCLSRKWHIFRNGGLNSGKLTNGFNSKLDAWSNYHEQMRLKSSIIFPCDLNFEIVTVKHSGQNFEVFEKMVHEELNSLLVQARKGGA